MARKLPRALLQRIRLVVLDVDGTMTDGRLYYGAQGEALKAFDVRDGHGLRLLTLYGGVKLAVLTGRRADLVEQRCRELSIGHVVGQSRAKGDDIERIADDLAILIAEAAFMGSYMNDLPLTVRVTLYLAPLAASFPERSEGERARIGRASFVNLGLAALEAARADGRDMRKTVELGPDAERVLRAVEAEGNGVVLVTGHIGAWELFARRVAALGFPCGTVAKEAHDPRLTALLQRSREAAGVRVFWRGDPMSARQILRFLRAGGMLGFLIDQDTRVAGHFVPFFGRPAFTPRAAGDLAARLGAPLVFACAHRVASGVHRMVVRPVDVPRTGDRERDSFALTAAATREIEAEIRKRPDGGGPRRRRDRPGPRHRHRGVRLRAFHRRAGRGRNCEPQRDRLGRRSGRHIARRYRADRTRVLRRRLPAQRRAGGGGGARLPRGRSRDGRAHRWHVHPAHRWRGRAPADGGAAVTGAIVLLAAAALLSGPLEFNARDMRIEPQGRRVLLDGDVRLTRGDLHVTGEHAVAEYGKQSAQKARARKAEAVAGGQTVERFTVRGNVRVQRGSRTATGEQGVVDVKGQTLVLTGTPETPPVVRDGAETLSGERILLRLDSEDVDVIRPRVVLRRSLAEEGHAAPPTPVKVEADHLVLLQARRLARFTDDVVLRRGDAVARSPRMEARYDADGQLTRLELRGGGDVPQGDRRATGEGADYDAQAAR